MGKNIATTSTVRKLDAKNSVFCNVAGSLRQVTLEDLSTSLGEIHTTQALRTVWNSGQPSTVLHQTGNRDVLIDYLQACKRYIFNSSGTKKAEIAYVEQLEKLDNSIVHFRDGYSTTVSALNTAGCNWMVLRPELGFFSTEEDGEEVFYCAGRGSIAGGHSFPKKYVGMFKAYVQGDVLKSQPNRDATGSITTKEFLNKAKSANENYGLFSYTDLCKENMIHLAYFANTNYEENVGVGLINNLSVTEKIKSGICMADMTNLIISYGTSPCIGSDGSTYHRVHFFGIEGLGEQFQETLGGVQLYNGNIYVWELNELELRTVQPYMRMFPLTKNSYMLMVQAIGGEYFDILSRTTINSESYNTYFCDKNGIAGTNGILRCNGHADMGSGSGISNVYIQEDFNYKGGYNKVRLSFYGEPLEVGGSEILN